MLPLSPEQEQQAVEAAVAVGWSTAEHAGRRAVVEALGIADADADAILTSLRERRIVRRAMQANDVIENGHVVVSPMRWERTGALTTLELLTFLTGQEETGGRDRTRQALARQFGVSETEADAFLHELRDRHLLTVENEAGRTRWVRADDAGGETR